MRRFLHDLLCFSLVAFLSLLILLIAVNLCGACELSKMRQFAKLSKPMTVADMVIRGPIVGAIAADVAYCTAATTCNTPPQYCDVLCEDMEGSTACHSGGEENCRSTWGETIHVGDSITWNTAVASDPCTGTINTNVLDIVFSAASNDTYATLYPGGVKRAEVYLQLYFRIVSENLASGETDEIFYLYDNTGSAYYGLYVKDIDGAGTKKIKLTFYNSSHTRAYSSDGATSIATGTWYKLGLKADSTNGTITYYVNDVEQITELATLDVNSGVDRIRIGRYNSGIFAGAANEFQYDNLAISSAIANVPGSCL